MAVAQRIGFCGVAASRRTGGKDGGRDAEGGWERLMMVAEIWLLIQSLYFLANAGRGTSERGMRHDRTQGETRSNAGRRSPKSIGIELAMMGRGGNTALDVAMCDISFFAESFLWL